MPYRVVHKFSGRVVPLYQKRRWKNKRLVKRFIKSRVNARLLGYRKVKKGTRK